MYMIYSVSGIVSHVDTETCVIEASGIGFHIIGTPSLLSHAKKGKKLTAFCVVGADFSALFGFLTLQERSLFDLLRTVPGIGPKMAMKILSRISVDDIAGLILLQDTEGLSKRAGVGSKTASKIVIELSEKLRGKNIASNTKISSQMELEEVLLGLGYEMSRVRSICSEKTTQTGSFEKRVKEALKLLAQEKRL